MTDREDQNTEAEEEEPNNKNSEIEISNQESAEKHSKNEVVVAPFTLPRKEKLRIATYELYNLEKKLAKELFRPWNRSFLPSKEDREKKMKEGRIVINDDGHKLIQENIIITTTSRKGKEKTDSDYPLPIVHDLILRFMLYIGNLKEMATNPQKSEDDWIRYFEDGAEPLRDINENLKKLMTDEILWMREEQSERYIKVHEIMCQLEEMNAILDGSQEIGIVTERELMGLELKICELRFKRFNNELDELERSMVIWEYNLEHGITKN